MSSDDQSDTLRMLGRLLEEEKASEVKIVNGDGLVRVFWHPAGGTAVDRTFREEELSRLREKAQSLRWGLADNPGTMQEVLRTIGLLAEEGNMDVGTITQEDDGWSLSGTANGRYLNRLLLHAELQAAIVQQRQKRADTGTAEVRPDRFSGVTVGSLVFTGDGQRLGSVRQIEGRFFLIKAPMLQRDYWLSAEDVATAEPDKRVDLSLLAAEVAQHKRTEPR